MDSLSYKLHWEMNHANNSEPPMPLEAQKRRYQTLLPAAPEISTALPASNLPPLNELEQASLHASVRGN